MHRSDLPIDDPCPADWEAMRGDDRRRFCLQCSKHVHHLSAMSRGEARALLERHAGGELCIGYELDADGGIVFAAPPPAPARPLSAAGRRLPLLAGLAGAGGALLSACGGEPAPAASTWPLQGDASVDAAAEVDGGGAGDAAAAWSPGQGGDEDAGRDEPGPADPWRAHDRDPAPPHTRVVTTPGVAQHAPCDAPPHAPAPGSAVPADGVVAAADAAAAPEAQPPHLRGEPRFLRGKIAVRPPPPQYPINPYSR